MADWLGSDRLQLGSVDPGAIWEALGTLLERPPWHADALCKEHPEVDFYLGPGGDPGPAKSLCARCLVADECARYALEHNVILGMEGGGIWGGTTPRQRKKLRVSLGIGPRVTLSEDERRARRAADSTRRSREQRERERWKREIEAGLRRHFDGDRGDGAAA